MTDVLTPAQRHLNMSRVRGKDTKPEVLVRRALHARGLRYRLHPRDVSGKPDIVFPKYGAVIFVHGCFWHGHLCSLFKWPATRQEFWQRKIEGNRERDAKTLVSLQEAGWRALVVWECSLRGAGRQSVDVVANRCERWLRAGPEFAEIVGALGIAASEKAG